MRRIWVLMAVAFVDMIGLMMIVPLLPLYAKSLGAAPVAIGFLAAAFPIAQLASSPVWGRVSDKKGRRPALLIGLAGSAVAYVIFGFADALWLLFLSRFAQGLGGGTTGVAQAYVADTVAPNERAKALGWLSAATSAGVIIGPGLGSLAHNLGSAAPALIAAGLIVINLGFAWRWLPESRRQPAPAPAGASPAPRKSRPIAHAVWEVARHPARPVSRLIWIYAIAMLPYNAVGLVFSLYLSERFAITENEIGFFFMAFGAVGVIMRIFVVGWMNDRLGEVRTMRLGATLYALGFLTIPLAGSLPVFVLCQLLLPLGTALLFPANSALVSHRAHQEELGLTLGVQQTFRGVSAIVGPILAGLAYQGLGPTVPFFAAGAIVVGALILAVREPNPVAVTEPVRA
ncbi:MAG: MFS transporter [Gemmatimonadales bacterium]